MNRAKRYSGPFTMTVAVLAFGFGLYLGVVSLAPQPEIRTVIQAPTLDAAKLADDLAECRANMKALRADQPVIFKDFSRRTP